MTEMHLTKKELQKLIQNIEAAGGDTSALKKLLEDSAVKAHAAANISTIDAESYVEQKWREAEAIPIFIGNCTMCPKLATEIRCGACEDCFKSWALYVWRKQKDRENKVKRFARL
jgi:hypothetical protein